jgi:hypothetical protein
VREIIVFTSLCLINSTATLDGNIVTRLLLALPSKTMWEDSGYPPSAAFPVSQQGKGLIENLPDMI